MFGPPEIIESRMLTDAEWGFAASKILEAGDKIDWHDKQLLSFLRWGVADLSAATPPISSFIDASPTVLQKHELFSAKFGEEVEKGWLGAATPRSTTRGLCQRR